MDTHLFFVTQLQSFHTFHQPLLLEYWACSPLFVDVVYVLLVDQVNVHSIHSLFYVFSNLLFLLKVDQVINRLIWSSIQLITKRFYDMLASMWHWSNCLKHMTQLDSYNYLENYVQNEAQLTNIVLKTNLVILHIVPHLFHLKSEEDCITSSYIDSDININFLLRAWVICHLHKKCLLSPKTRTANTFRPVLLSLGMTQFTLKLSQHLLLTSLRKVLTVNSSI